MRVTLLAAGIGFLVLVPTGTAVLMILFSDEHFGLRWRALRRPLASRIPAWTFVTFIRHVARLPFCVCQPMQTSMREARKVAVGDATALQYQSELRLRNRGTQPWWILAPTK